MSAKPEYEAEIVELHTFFEDWYHGRIPATEDCFDRLRDVLADGFEMVVPDGSIRSREAVLSGIESQHGARAEADPEFTIEIRNHSVLDVSSERALCRYEEHQRVEGEWEGRVSTVLFRQVPDAPNGVEWVHVHETWLPE